MASEKQIAANRRNSLKSTGPRTPEGRAVGRLHALKHGLTAKELIIFDETEKDFEDFAAEIFPALNTADAAQDEIGRHIVMNLWAWRRARRAEAGLFNDAGDHSCGVFTSMHQAIATHTRYDAAMNRRLDSLYKRLHYLQSNCRDEAAPTRVAPPTPVAPTPIAPAQVAPPTPVAPKPVAPPTPGATSGSVPGDAAAAPAAARHAPTGDRQMSMALPARASNGASPNSAAPERGEPVLANCETNPV